MPWLESTKGWASRLKRDVIALWIAARDFRTPVLAKIVAAAVAAYALSPLDLIPDFIPVFGYPDDTLEHHAGGQARAGTVDGRVSRDGSAARATSGQPNGSGANRCHMGGGRRIRRSDVQVASLLRRAYFEEAVSFCESSLLRICGFERGLSAA